jgi:hypothetical protein
MADKIGLGKLSLALAVGADTCFDIKGKDADADKRVGKDALAKLKEVTREDGTETELRLCRVAADDFVVIYRTDSALTGEGVTTQIESWAYETGKDGKLVESFEGDIVSELKK